MKRKCLIPLYFMGILLLLQSCEPEIKDDFRILVKGSIVDSQNNPVPNISVRCQTYSIILGQAVSDANGQFQFTSLEVESYNSLNILVNMKSNNYYDWNYDYYEGGLNYDLTENPDYSGKQYFSNSQNRPAATYNLEKIQLNEASRLAVLFTNIPGDNNAVAYKLEYDSAICLIDLNLNDSEECHFDDDFYQQLDINSNNFQINLNSQLGTTVKLKYILNNDPEQTISIPLTNLENTYVFEY